MNIKHAKMNVRATCGDSFILTDISPVYNYVDGKRVGDPVAYSYTVILPQRKYETLRVRIAGDCLMAVPDDPVEVKVDNLQLEIKWSAHDGNYIAGTATGIAPVANT